MLLPCRYFPVHYRPRTTLTAQHAEEQDNGNWKIKGLDDDGEELTVIVSLADRIEIITIM